MDIKRLALPLGAIAAAGVFLFWYNNAERVLVRKTKDLIDTINVAPGGSHISKGFGREAFAAFLSPTVRLKTPEKEANGSYEKEELANNFGGFSIVVESANFSATNLAPKSSGTTGVVTGDIDYEVTINSSDTRTGNCTATFTWSKTTGKWLISEVELNEIKP